MLGLHRVLIAILLTIYLFAREETFVREYTYQASEYDSKVTSRANSLNQIKKLLLEEVSVFIVSEVDWTQEETIIDGKYTMQDVYQENIISITAGITETKIIDEKWSGVEYWLKVEITIDSDDIENKLKSVINDKEKLRELNQVKLKLDEANAEIEILKTQLLNVDSDDDEAELIKKYNIQTDKLSALDWYYKGVNAGLNNDWLNSKSSFLKSLELNQDNVSTLYNLGSTYIFLGNYIKGLEYLKKAIKLSPDFAEAYHLLGFANKELDNNIDAISLYNKAIELNPNKASFHVNLGILFSENNEIEKSIQSINRAIKLEPNSTYAHFNIGLIYTQTGDYIKGIEHLEIAIENEPAKDNNYSALGTLYFKYGLEYYDNNNYVKSLQLFQKSDELFSSIEFNSNDNVIRIEVYNKIASIYYNQGDYSNTVKYLEKLTKLDESATSFGFLGTVYTQLNNYEKAIPNLEKSVILKPSASIYRMLGASYYNQKLYEKSIESYESSLILDPSSLKTKEKLGSLCFQIGVKYYKNGQRKQGLIYIEKASLLGNNTAIELLSNNPLRSTDFK